MTDLDTAVMRLRQGARIPFCRLLGLGDQGIEEVEDVIGGCLVVVRSWRSGRCALAA